jgi:putative sigma-54 modulation protein
MTSKAKLVDQQAYNVIVTGRHLEVTEAMKNHAIEKLSKLDRFHDRIIDIAVTMDIQRVNHRVDIRMKVNNIKIKSQAITDNMYASIDQAVHKLQNQLRRYKGRIQDHQTHVGSIVNMPVKIVRAPKEDLTEFNDDIEEENYRQIEESLRPHSIVETETRPLKTLSNSEAVMKLELSLDRFFIYRDEVDRRLKVMYRRHDGNYGIIEVEA